MLLRFIVFIIGSTQAFRRKAVRLLRFLPSCGGYRLSEYYLASVYPQN